MLAEVDGGGVGVHAAFQRQVDDSFTKLMFDGRDWRQQRTDHTSGRIVVR